MGSLPNTGFSDVGLRPFMEFITYTEGQLLHGRPLGKVVETNPIEMGFGQVG